MVDVLYHRDRIVYRDFQLQGTDDGRPFNSMIMLRPVSCI